MSAIVLEDHRVLTKPSIDEYILKELKASYIYERGDRPIAKRAADEYIANLLREAEQVTLNF